MFRQVEFMLSTNDRDSVANTAALIGVSSPRGGSESTVSGTTSTAETAVSGSNTSGILDKCFASFRSFFSKYHEQCQNQQPSRAKMLSASCKAWEKKRFFSIPS